ncbi:hypothetical protein SASPL_111806 [Salvia splendens]|uniref:Uncharacterized protein n=1 Tax=Salvia splendens TaxID=180675 RepID=A0A8X8Y724_SALSN|nr:hypothetical protein SASPL_111806 [Salvia splendens]
MMHLWSFLQTFMWRLTARIGSEFDMGKVQREVFDKLGTVDGLTLAERYELCDILSKKSQRLEICMASPSAPPGQDAFIAWGGGRQRIFSKLSIRSKVYEANA